MKILTKKKFNNYYSDKSLKLSSNGDTIFIYGLFFSARGGTQSCQPRNALPLSHTPDPKHKSEPTS